ncbi:MAG TPA: M23 family metallopeptidase, partial [Propionibacterium sp.]|nr:M23 family metallopeptidase [Propionibacterium sp.]
PKTYPLANTGAQMILSPQGFIRPLLARPGSPFGPRFHPILKYWRPHNGNDWGAACGVPLYAAQSGTVVKAGWQGGFGNYVIIDHGVIGGKSVMTGYAHQQKMVVRAGQRVEMGQHIGYVGTTGLSTGCHLHLQVYENGTPVDPMRYIP